VMPDSTGSLSARDIRARLSGTQPAEDPTLIDVAVATRGWRPGFRERLSDTLAPAAVLIPIVDRPDGLSVLFTRRSAKLKHHSGQVSFPGGRMEVCDVDIVETALRETGEELGIHPHQVEVAGFLSPIATLTGYAVTPVVGLLADDTRLTLDHTEVESVFEVPLGVPLRWSANLGRHRRHTNRLARCSIAGEWAPASRLVGVRWPPHGQLAETRSGTIPPHLHSKFLPVNHVYCLAGFETIASTLEAFGAGEREWAIPSVERPPEATARRRHCLRQRIGAGESAGPKSGRSGRCCRSLQSIRARAPRGGPAAGGAADRKDLVVVKSTT
jgi:8-oxo-dGTP pyrophosphatase MutT (NUDIX family)